MPEEEELDSMFRQAADSFQPEFDPEAWREMEKKLDAPERQKPATTKWIKRSVLLLLLMISGWLVYRYAQKDGVAGEEKIEIQASDSSSKAQQDLSASEKPGKDLNQHPFGSTGNDNGSTSTIAKKDKTSKIIQQPGQVNRSITNQPAIKTTAPYHGKATQVNKQVIVLKNSEQKNADNNVSNTNKPENSGISQVIINNEQPADSVAKESESLIRKQTEGFKEDSNEEKAVLAQTPKVVLDSTQLKAVADSALKNSHTRFINKLAVALVLGPDFSTVGFVKPEKASTNVGIGLSYQISKRWALGTGLVRARKFYGAKPEDYHPGANYWPAGAHLPDDINAVCKVLDIPLNVRYSFLALPTHVAYVQTGLSSYIMLHEDYRYDYKKYGTPYSKHWIVTNQNRHFFQVLNLSVGYSRQLSPGISLGAEPFVKIPLAGIGAGKVNLTSMGVFFNVGYSFR
ncbi:MAG: hypothetical protein M3Q05_09595 [Bacteroidota bacterium]|nr:hypothetical protein [Bacteroidota bacterium]